MKVWVSSIIFVLLLIVPIAPSAHLEAKEGLKMIILIDGKPLDYNKAPFTDGRKRFVPLRPVLEQMGWEVSWSPEEISVRYQADGATHHTSLRGDYDGIRMHERTAYIEIRDLKALTSATVEWNDESGVISIVSGDPLSYLEDAMPGFKEIRSKYEAENQEKPPLTEEQSQKANFGKYEVPPTLKALFETYNELETEGHDMSQVLGFYPSLGHSIYFNTPNDVVVFGWTGGDGDHYGFLTDYGSVADLENAPIVMVTPMSFDQPAVVVANNLREFLRIVMINESLLYMGYENEQEYLESEREMLEEWKKQGYYREETEEERLSKRAILKKMEEKLNPPLIKDPYRYSAQVAKEREKRIIAPTLDQLGVINVYPSDAGRQHSPLLVDEDLEMEELTRFLKLATYAEKLALFRDYNLEHLEYEVEIREALMNEMKSMGLIDELARWQAKY